MTRELDLPALAVLLAPQEGGLPLTALAAEAAAGGATMIHLRAHWLPEPELITLTQELVMAVEGRAAVIINGDLPAADLADGIHLPERLGPEAITAARASRPEPLLVGRSVHSPDAAAASLGADYLFAGHIHATASHPGEEPIGISGLRRIIAVAPVPVVAIGGITPDRVAEVIAAGAAGVAVISYVTTAADPRAATARLRQALDAAWNDRSIGSTAMDNEPAIAVVRITVNGKHVEVGAGWSVHDFLASKRMSDGMAIVERNGLIVPRGEYGATLLAEGDVLEVVHAVGGG